MRATKPHHAPRRSAWATLIVSALLAAGCAGGAWLESPLPAELPLDPPKKSYPTAVKAAIAPQVPNTSHSAAQTTASDAVAAHSDSHPQQVEASTTQPHSQRLDRPQPLRTTLAVIPAQYVHAPVNPPSVATQTSSSAQPSGERVNVAPVLTDWPSSSVLPQLDAALQISTNSVQLPAASIQATTASNPTADASTAKNAVQPVAHEEKISPADRQEKLEQTQRALIEALEAEIRDRRAAESSDAELPRLEQQLRLAYIAAGRIDDAVSAIESLDQSQRDAYKNLMFGLGVWMSPDEARRSPLRTAKVLHSLRDATTDLTAASKLELKNLAFCERVDHFGWYTEFPRKEFQPKQQVILYAEVENFAAEQKGPAGFETELQGSYVILDSSGQEVASRQLQLDKEICRNYRRDYFLAYRIYLPDAIAPGRYRLELTIEDLKARAKYQGRKLGDGIIEFTIR